MHDIVHEADMSRFLSDYNKFNSAVKWRGHIFLAFKNLILHGGNEKIVEFLRIREKNFNMF